MGRGKNRRHEDPPVEKLCDEIVADDVDPDEKRDKEPIIYVLAKRQSVTSKRGIINEGEDVFPFDLHGGEVAFNDFVSKGIFVPKD